LVDGGRYDARAACGAVDNAAPIVGIIVVVMNRRGSTGASRADDRSADHKPDGTQGTGYVSDGGGGMGGF
jgi:hypothetical protein